MFYKRNAKFLCSKLWRQNACEFGNWKPVTYVWLQRMTASVNLLQVFTSRHSLRIKVKRFTATRLMLHGKQLQQFAATTACQFVTLCIEVFQK